VFTTYVSRHGRVFIDRALYLPKEWTDNRKRLKAAHVPDGVGFVTKPQIARKMIARAITTKVPFAFVAADSAYGVGDIETMLRKAGKAMSWALLPIACSTPGARSYLSAEPLLTSLKVFPKALGGACRRGKQPRGPRLHDWAYLELADRDAGEYSDTLTGPWTRGLLIWRSIADPAELAFFSTWCPEGALMKKLVSVEGHR
jgi:SRSO17 transposase